MRKSLPSSVVHGDFPIFHFSYEGVLPPYSEIRKEQVKVRDYYLTETLQSYDWTAVNDQFDKAAVYVAHYFASDRKRDLDNRNRKYLLDALRRTLLIKDDSWQYISWMEEGFRDDRDHIEVFVMDRKYFPCFLKLGQMCRTES